MINIVKQAPLTSRLLKICMGTRGFEVPLHCQRTKATEMAKPTTRVATTWAELQGYSPPPHVKPSIKTAVPARARKAPKKSTSLILSFQSPSTFRKGMKQKTHNADNAESGKLRRKIHLHEPCEIDDKEPPMIGPMPFEMPTAAPSIPWYLPRSLSGTTSLTIICATVINPPPPTPVSARKAINWEAVLAREAANDPTKKMANPTNNIGFLDQISENRP